LVLAGITFFLFKNKPTGFLPTEDEGRVFITFELPEASSQQEQLKFHQGMGVLGEIDGVGHYAAIAGLNVVSFSNKSNNCTLFCQFKPWDERKSESMQLAGMITQLQQRFAAIKEAKFNGHPAPAIPGLEERADSVSLCSNGKVLTTYMLKMLP
jgi:HAE1 family hydrophobic/amphiphilic exporter-1